MNTMITVAITIAALTALVSLALILRFLWRVYERGGQDDLVAAAKALRQVHDPNWASSLGQVTLGAGKTRTLK